MEREPRQNTGGLPRPDLMIPTGSIYLGEERWRYLLPQWEIMYRAMRGMDSLALGESEPATVFEWEELS